MLGAAEGDAFPVSHHRQPTGGSQDACTSTGEQIDNGVRRMYGLKEGITGRDVGREEWERSVLREREACHRKAGQI